MINSERMIEKKGDCPWDFEKIRESAFVLNCLFVLECTWFHFNKKYFCIKDGSLLALKREFYVKKRLK